MAKDPRVDEILITLARIDERIGLYAKFGTAITLLLLGWLGWVTNRVVSGPVSLAAIAVAPVNEKTIRKAKQIVAAAWKDKDGQRISSDLVRSVGQNMISASAGTNAELAREAWSTAIELMDYRSLLNVNLNPIPLNAHARTMSEFLFELSFASPHGMEVGELMKTLHTFGDDVPIEQAARLERLGSTANAGRVMGPRVIVMQFPNNPIKLDDTWYKNVVIQNTKIVYLGGRTKLENVYFINCEFQMENLAPARALGEQMIANAAVSFDGTLLSQRIIENDDANKSASVRTLFAIPASIAGVARKLR